MKLRGNADGPFNPVIKFANLVAIEVQSLERRRWFAARRPEVELSFWSDLEAAEAAQFRETRTLPHFDHHEFWLAWRKRHPDYE